MHKVIVDGKPWLVHSGALLSDVLKGARSSVDHPCGGRGTCKKCTVLVNGEAVLACQYAVTSDISVQIPQHSEILSDSGAVESNLLTQNMCLVLDVGTTTLALALVSIDENKIVKVLTCTNPQTAFGADVMTRIDYCNKNGVSKLQEAVVNQINSMICQISPADVDMLYVSGNTTMLHLLFGVDPSPMGRAPYTPVFLDSKRCAADLLGICGAGWVVLLPSISAFVGADLVAGLNFVGMPREGKYNLLVDLGTNAEIVLYSAKEAVCTAAAAGPCFEGANISCGMCAESGAVWAYEKGRLETINDAPARGICGTGLIDLIAELLEGGTIDESGYMECERFSLTLNVYLTQGDVRQFQLAKSAVNSAICTLLKMQGTSFADIDTVYLSGGFSAKINIQNAVKTGLLPKSLQEKCVAVKNSSLLGTVKYAVEKNDLSAYTQNTAYIDLSADPYFAEKFMENMLFE